MGMVTFIKARSILAYDTGLNLDPLNNCLQVYYGLLIGVKLAWMWISCSIANRALVCMWYVGTVVHDPDMLWIALVITLGL